MPGAQPHPQTSFRPRIAVRDKLRPESVQASGMRGVDVCPDPGLRRDDGWCGFSQWRWGVICVGFWSTLVALALISKPQLSDDWGFRWRAIRELLQTTPANADLTANHFWTYGLPVLGVLTVLCFKKVAGLMTRFIKPKVNEDA